MKRLVKLALAFSFLALAQAGAARAAESPARAPVLLELFTSEGCSSCPSADALLERLLRTQPVAGAQLIGLSEHVDYWNSLGWKDPFSSSDFTARQSRYAQQLHSHNYTPQLVVDGKLDVVGSDEAGALAAIKATLSERRGTVTLQRLPSKSPLEVVLHVETRGLLPQGSVQVLLAVVEDGLQSQVLRGENQGRTLPHAAVVRALLTIGRLTDKEWSGDAEVPLEAAWKRERLSAVVFVQERESGRILAASSLALAER